MSTAARILIDATGAGGLAALVALTIGGLGETLDQHDSQKNTGAAIARAVADAQAADAQQCQAIHGENASAVQLPDGSHRCVNKHGRRLNGATTAAGRKVTQ